jgi:hypothetical protein
LAEAGHEVVDADAENIRGQVVDLAIIILPGDRWRLRYKVRHKRHVLGMRNHPHEEAGSAP